MSAFDESLVALAAGIGGFVGEVTGRDGLPVETRCTCLQQDLVVSYAPDCCISLHGGRCCRVRHGCCRHGPGHGRSDLLGHDW